MTSDPATFNMKDFFLPRWRIEALSHRKHVHTHKPATAQPGEPPTAPQARRGKAAQRKLYLRARITARRWVRYVGCQAPDLTHPPVGGHLSPVPAPSDTARTHPPQKFESAESIFEISKIAEEKVQNVSFHNHMVARCHIKN